MSWPYLYMRLWISMMLYTLLAAQDKSSFPYVMVEQPADLSPKSFTDSDIGEYRTLAVHDNIFYIGGRAILYRQDPDNISESKLTPVPWEVIPSVEGVCRRLPQGNDGTCDNFIRVVQSYNRTHILLCGSMALEPKNAFLNTRDGSVEEAKDIQTPLCSYDPADEATLLLAKESSSFTSIAFTSRTLTKPQTTLVKTLSSSTALRTSQGRGKMIDVDPKFIHSFRANEVVSGRTVEKFYFVFRETKEYKSRIAQVCANDRGNVVSVGQWTTFLKASFLCQTKGFAFDMITHSTVSEDGIFYGSFTPLSDFVTISAVCAYRVTDIQKAFRVHKYREASPSGSGYTVRSEEIPQNPSPGECPYPGMGGVANATTESFGSNLVTFMLEHPLVDTPIVPTVGPGGPLFTLNNERITKIAVQKVRAVDGKHYDVIFMATKSGKVFKFLPVLKSVDVEIVKLAEYKLFDMEITGMILSSEHNNLYVQTASELKQVATGNCELYTKSCPFCDPCRMCVLSRDPMCAWDNHIKRCADIRYSVHNSSVLFQSIGAVSADVCGEVEVNEIQEPVRNTGVTAGIGKQVFNPLIDVTWCNHIVEPAEEIKGDTEKYHITGEKKLEINNFNAGDVGRYVATYTLRGVHVAIEASTFTDHINTVPPPTPPSTTESPVLTTHLSATGNDSVTDSSIETTLASNLTAGGIFGIVFAMSFLMVIFLACFYFFIWKKDCCSFHSATKNPKKNPDDLRAKRHGDDVTDSVHYVNTNNSNFTSDTRSPADDVTQEEKVNLIQEIAKPTHLSLSQESNPPLQKKVAKVLPYEQGSVPLLSSPIDFIDNVTTPPADEDHQRKPPQRTKSIPSQNIRVKIDNDRMIKCNSIRRDKQRGTWFLEIDLPEDCVFDGEVGESSRLGSDDFEKSTDIFSNEEPFDEVDAKTSLTTPDDFQASGDNATSLHVDLPGADTDSDSTLKASNSTMKQFDSPSSSSASTPRQYDTTKPLLASSYHTRLMEAPASHPGDGKSPNDGSWSNNQPDSSRGLTWNDKSPTSTGSSSSNSSDKFHTAPPSPVGGSAG